MPWSVISSSFQESERLQTEEPERFDAIVAESIVAEPDLASRDAVALVALYLYDQRVNN